jgi:hypothetical protein
VPRPAYRRASQQDALPPGPNPAPYRPDPGPYPPGPGPYPPGPGPYPPDPGSYGSSAPPRPAYEPPGPRDGSPGPRHAPPGRRPYRPDTQVDDRRPYERDTQVFRRIPRGPQPPYQPGPEGPEGPEGPVGFDDDLDDGFDDGFDEGFDHRPGHRRARRPGRVRRFFRLRTVRVIAALVAVFCIWLAFSLGQALTAPGGGSVSSKLAEWARDHYLGPVVTFGEWLTYQPPKVGGKPGFSLAVPSSDPTRYHRTRTFQPIIPQRLTSPAGQPLPGEGQWRVLETVKGQPAMFGTFLRPSSVYTSYVAGIVSMDQRLVTFQLHPGAEDPGAGHWKSPSWIPNGSRTGLIGTFNGGFKLDSSRGGFYLNGVTHGTLVKGAASVVYYRNGTVKIGEWGRDVTMTSAVVGVRQNLKLVVDHGQVPASVNTDVQTNWGATLGGGYYVWRSGLGITGDGRIIFVYGPALNVKELAGLLQRAGAVEALQLDINPEWMSFEYYKTDGHPSDPTPVNLLPTQASSAYRYYAVYSRDFTAVYAR